MAIKKPIYRVRWGEIYRCTLIKESPKTFLVRNDHNHTFRAWKNRTWSGVNGGRLYQTEKCFRNGLDAIKYAKDQIEAYKAWAMRHFKEAAKLEKELSEKWT